MPSDGEIVLGVVVGAIIGFGIVCVLLRRTERLATIEYRHPGYQLLNSAEVARVTKYGRKS